MFQETYVSKSSAVNRTLENLAALPLYFNFIRVKKYSKWIDSPLYRKWSVCINIHTTRNDFVVICNNNYKEVIINWFNNTNNNGLVLFDKVNDTINSLNFLNRAISYSSLVKEENLVSLKNDTKIENEILFHCIKAMNNNDIPAMRGLKKQGWVGALTRYNKGKCLIAKLPINGSEVVICVCYGKLHFIKLETGKTFYTSYANYSKTSAKYVNLAGGCVSKSKNEAGYYQFIDSSPLSFMD